MKKIVLSATVALSLGACAPGEVTRIQVTMPRGEKATIVAHDQTVPDWMLSRDKLALNFIVKGDVSSEQLTAVSEAERACRIYTGTVRPNNLVAVLSQGALYATAGFVGVGLGSQAFAGVNSLAYGAYGAGASGMAGLANGTVSLGGQTYTFENCGREIFDIFPDYKVRILQKSPY